MSIMAVNTMEIRLHTGASACLEENLRHFVAGLGELPGCVAYSVTRSAVESDLWILSGHWRGEEQMISHFSDELLEAMVRSLVGYPVAISFSHFVAADTATQYLRT